MSECPSKSLTSALPEHRPGIAGDDLGFALPEPAVLTKARAFAIAIGILAVLAAAFAAAYLPKQHAREQLEASTKALDDQAQRVNVVTPTVVASDRALVLPGSVQPLQETVIYPRASGYVRKWLVDIGDKVKEGDLLAEIDTPELDQGLAQAQAELKQAQAGVVQSHANRDFSKTNLQRYRELAPSGVASQQELEQHQAQASVDEANMSVAEAAVGAQQANIRRLLQLRSFAHVVSPFAGTVTQRTIDIGALVSAGSATPMFKVATTDPVRVFVQVPQDVAPSIRQSAAAKVTVREYPGRDFDGIVSRAAGALDNLTRTMTTEVRVPNPKNELLTGMYAEVSLVLPLPHKVFELPATTLINDSKGMRVAVVDDENHVHFAPIVLERDTGATVQISSGLVGNEHVVKIGSADLFDGKVVEVIP